MGPKGVKKSNNVIITSNDSNSTNSILESKSEESTQVKAKRGRKSKKELMAALNIAEPISLNLNNVDSSILNKKEEILSYDIHIDVVIHEIKDYNIDNSNFLKDKEKEKDKDKDKDEHVIKKRGRKPKGGKIIQPTTSIESYKEDKPNVILHLKCSLKDINESFDSITNVESYNFTKNDYGFDLYGNDNINVTNYNLNNNNNSTSIVSLNNNSNVSNYYNNDYGFDDDDDDDNKFNKEKDKTKEIWRKLKMLEQNLHVNNINNKKSCCFWDTCEFDGPPVYAPKYRRNGIIYVEGCFCCPQCAAAHIINKPNIDNSSKFECLYLLNYLYGSIYNYTKNINPAPDPHYMLQKFLGNLTIQEYRSLLGNERLFLIVDKPLTRILPELHEYNDEFILNNKIIPSNNYQLKVRLQKKKQDKTTIMNEKFGIGSTQFCE
jgi:hypothetical protein